MLLTTKFSSASIATLRIGNVADQAWLSTAFLHFVTNFEYPKLAIDPLGNFTEIALSAYEHKYTRTTSSECKLLRRYVHKYLQRSYWQSEVAHPTISKPRYSYLVGTNLVLGKLWMTILMIGDQNLFCTFSATIIDSC